MATVDPPGRPSSAHDEPVVCLKVVSHVLDGIIAPIYLRVLFDVGGLDRDFLRELAARTVAVAEARHRRNPTGT